MIFQVKTVPTAPIYRTDALFAERSKYFTDTYIIYIYPFFNAVRVVCNCVFF